ncbi:MAG: thioredoxin family protein [Bacteroidetes bacterium]|nr:thioredoxin family protein [Bacteroidota bacterium]MCL5739190.1 thioredoxin family protein [Bacteroidota bacterium]
MIIKILGSGCPNCKTLERRAIQAAEELNISAEFKEVRDFKEIASYGIMRTPGLAINEKVVSAGYVPKVDEIKALILEHASQEDTSNKVQ